MKYSQLTAAILASLLIPFSSIQSAESSISTDQKEAAPLASNITQAGALPKNPLTREVLGSEKEEIFTKIVQSQSELGLCLGYDIRENLKNSRIYAQDFSLGHSHYLVNIYCRKTIRDGVHEFVTITRQNNQEKFRHTGVSLTGLPVFDGHSNLLTNGYGFRSGAKVDCGITTQYHWSGTALNLLTVERHEETKNGCQEWRVHNPQPDSLITDTRVGVAKLGMTLQDLRRVLPPHAHIEEIEPDFEWGPRLRLRVQGRSLILMFEPQEDLEIPDHAKIIGIMVQDPSFMTAAGIGPGTLIEEAIAAYGQATLSYVDRSDSGEEITFQNGPFPRTSDTRIIIYPSNTVQNGLVGQYPTSDTFLKQTQQYREGAAIGSITLIDPSYN